MKCYSSNQIAVYYGILQCVILWYLVQPGEISGKAGLQDKHKE